jgi:hypothetical protein
MAQGGESGPEAHPTSVVSASHLPGRVDEGPAPDRALVKAMEKAKTLAQPRGTPRRRGSGMRMTALCGARSPKVPCCFYGTPAMPKRSGLFCGPSPLRRLRHQDGLESLRAYGCQHDDDVHPCFDPGRARRLESCGPAWREGHFGSDVLI